VYVHLNFQVFQSPQLLFQSPNCLLQPYKLILELFYRLESFSFTFFRSIWMQVRPQFVNGGTYEPLRFKQATNTLPASLPLKEYVSLSSSMVSDDLFSLEISPLEATKVGQMFS